MRIRNAVTARKNGRRGANAIEFALTAPILFTLILAIFDYGWYFAHRILLENATGHAARVAALSMSDLALTGATDVATAGNAAWDAYGLPGNDPVFITTLTPVSGHNMLDVQGTLVYDSFVLPATIIPTTITVNVSRRAENVLEAVAVP